MYYIINFDVFLSKLNMTSTHSLSYYDQQVFIKKKLNHINLILPDKNNKNGIVYHHLNTVVFLIPDDTLTHYNIILLDRIKQSNQHHVFLIIIQDALLQILNVIPLKCSRNSLQEGYLNLIIEFTTFSIHSLELLDISQVQLKLFVDYCLTNIKDKCVDSLLII